MRDIQASTEELAIERVDDIPLLMGLQQQLGLAAIIDESIPRHGLHQGLSLGELFICWISYILSEADHRKVAVESWGVEHQRLLSEMLSQHVRRVDFTDDRLSSALCYLACDASWQAIEQKLWQNSVVAYELQAECVRLDASRIVGYHRPSDEGLMQWGYPSKADGLTQQKLMVASVDCGGCGHLISTEPISGQTADDVLYQAAIEKVRQTVGHRGLLYLGDSKMSAIETRAELACGGDFYLMPLARVGEVPSLYQQCIDSMTEKQQAATLIYQMDDEAQPTELIACGYQTSRIQQAVGPDGQSHTWDERILVVRSLAKAKKQLATLEGKLLKAQEALVALTPEPGRGRRAIRDQETLIKKADALLTQHGVSDYLSYTYDQKESVKTRYIGRGRPSANRKTKEIRTVHYRITAVIRDQQKIHNAFCQMGTRLYATNCADTDLPLDEAVRLYRAAPRIERHFHLLKAKPIGISPMYVRGDDQIKGLTRLLTLCVRMLTLIEIITRRELKRQGQTLAGLYQGNPNRRTNSPTATRILRAFHGIDCIRFRNKASPYITPLNDLQLAILAMLALDDQIYQPAPIQSTPLKAFAKTCGALLATICYR